MHLLNKSNVNFAAASLIKDTHSNSSVHCSYYGCFQILKYILVEKVGKKEPDIEAERVQRSKAKGKQIGTHEIIIELLCEHFVNLVDRKVFTDVRGWIYDLKNFRMESDYKNAEIVKSDGVKAYTTATKIRDELNKAYYFIK
jgi:hypothetical protein